MNPSPPTSIERIPTRDLCFDHQNPRLAEYGITPQTDEKEILRILWENMDIRELVQSIAASGFFQHEALIVSEEDGRLIVIEGNRRLAAVKVLLHPEIAEENNWEVETADPSILEDLETLPAIRADRNDSWRFLGFKHVNGPAKWSSFAKAHYIAQVHREYGVSLDDIASQIGDRHKTVQRLYRGLMVLEQAETVGVFDREDRFRTRFAFSHLYTGLDYEGISNFLSLSPQEAESDTPVPESHHKELGELMLWLYGSKKEKIPPLVESQNPHLRQLNAALGDREATAGLRAGLELSKAFEISQPPGQRFEESLLAAKRELTNARGVMTTGYDNSEALLRIAGSVANLADDLYKDMERKRNELSPKRRLSE
jgi:hypothetical protein